VSTAISGDATASTPVGAALLVGVSVPARLQEHVRWVILHTDPQHEATEDGSLSWEWKSLGVWIRVQVGADGVSEARFLINEQTSPTVDGKIVRKEIRN
jgi:hypothetical protein